MAKHRLQKIIAELVIVDLLIEKARQFKKAFDTAKTYAAPEMEENFIGYRNPFEVLFEVYQLIPETIKDYKELQEEIETFCKKEFNHESLWPKLWDGISVMLTIYLAAYLDKPWQKKIGSIIRNEK